MTSITTCGAMSANLQAGRSIRLIAELMNISERMIYMALDLRKSGCDDLIAAVERGELSLHAALKQAKPSRYGKPRDNLKVLMRAWGVATASERAAFLRRVST